MIERLFDLVKDEVVEHGSKICINSTQQKRQVRRLHRHMKRDTSSLVVATLRTGFLVGFAVILILVLFPAIAAQAAGPR
jgi:hypothetical protein